METIITGLPVFARLNGDLSDYVLVLSAILAYFAYALLTYLAGLIAGVAEGLAVLWGIMLLVRKRKGTPHWFWRPMLWSIGLALVPALGVALNIVLTHSLIGEKNASIPGQLLLHAVPALIGVPFLLLLLVLCLVYAIRGIREMWGHGATGNTGSAGVDYKAAAGSAGKRALAWLCMVVGRLMMAGGLLWTGLVIIALAMGKDSGVNQDPLAAAILLFPVVITSPAAFALWRWAREGGSLHPETSESNL